MNEFEKIKAMSIDEISHKFAVTFFAGCFAILRKAGISEDDIKKFGKDNLVEVICCYKQWLQQESEG